MENNHLVYQVSISVLDASQNGGILLYMYVWNYSILDVRISNCGTQKEHTDLISNVVNILMIFENIDLNLWYIYTKNVHIICET